ncbi:MAG: site-2 protease family protein [Ruminococcaceae bacterium]|nr:site-2 protease family protein [Oscillospiraceae bacterium]
MSEIAYNIMTMLLGMVALLISITLHEVAHGYAAYKMGDYTAKSSGRLSLNPFAHINPASLLLLAILMLIGSFSGASSGFVMSMLSVMVCFTFARPVPVGSGGLKNPLRDMAIIAVAGPVTNILVALISLILFKYISYLLVYILPDTQFGMYVAFMTMYFFVYLTQLNIGLAVFNLLPIPPLDGSKILYYFLPRKMLIAFVKYEKYITMILLFLLIFDVLDVPLDYIGGLVYRGLSFVVDLLPPR